MVEDLLTLSLTYMEVTFPRNERAVILVVRLKFVIPSMVDYIPHRRYKPGSCMLTTNKTTQDLLTVKVLWILKIITDVTICDAISKNNHRLKIDIEIKKWDTYPRFVLKNQPEKSKPKPHLRAFTSADLDMQLKQLKQCGWESGNFTL